MKRGATVLELLVGLVTAVIIGAVCAKVLQLGIMTHAFAVRQSDSLTRTRKAAAGDGSHYGLLWAGRGAHTFAGLSASTASVLSSTSSVVTSFYVAGNNLYRTKASASVLQADAVTALSINYYNMNSSGLIMVSTAASAATMMTSSVTVRGNSSQKTYTLFTGAQLRNHQ